MREKDAAKIKQLDELIELHSQAETQESKDITRKAQWLKAWLQHDRNLTVAAKETGCEYWQLHRLVRKAHGYGVKGACVSVVRYGFKLTPEDRAFLENLHTHPREIVRKHARAVQAYHDGGHKHATEMTGYTKKTVCEIMQGVVEAGSDWRSRIANPTGTGRVIQLMLTDADSRELDRIIAEPVSAKDTHGQTRKARAEALRAIASEKMRRSEILERFGISENSISRLLTAVRRVGVAEALTRGVFVREIIRNGSNPKPTDPASATTSATVSADEFDEYIDESDDGATPDTGEFNTGDLSDTSNAPIAASEGADMAEGRADDGEVVAA